MSSDDHRKILRPHELAVLASVLERFDLQTKTSEEATGFLIHKFQEGMMREDDLVEALQVHLKAQRS